MWVTALSSFNKKTARYIARIVFVGLAFQSNAFVYAQSTASISATIPAQEAQNLELAGQLLKAGALHLALDHLQTHPPSVATVAVWQAWAEQKWSILILLKDWQALKHDARGLPASFGGAKNFSIAYQAQALIALGEYDQARRLLQPALLDDRIPLRFQKEIRAQLIALYQAQGDFINAKIEAVRFHNDFAPQETAWFIRRAVIEYLAGDAKGASALLAANASIEAKLLLILFRFEAGALDHAAAHAQITKQLQRKRIIPAERKLAHGIVVSIRRGDEDVDHIRRIEALQRYVTMRADDLQPDVIHFNEQDLKAAYLVLSTRLINQAQQAPGRNGLTYTLAQQFEAGGENIQARALYVNVLLDKDDEILATAAKNQFISGLINAEEYALLTRLFGEDKPLGDYATINSTSSAQILDHALEAGDADIISSIAPYLSAAPDNVDPRDWVLQKARIDIFAGRFEQGRDKIIEWLAQSDILTGEEVDRVLQPIFDLQAVQQNDISLALFDLIEQQTQSKRHKREIYFWKAQSYEAKEARITAAQYYLRSALVEANGFDQWGHSARYHAAATLMEAGKYVDARRLFEGLLAATTDTPRRATIKQGLQRLWLLENQNNQ